MGDSAGKRVSLDVGGRKPSSESSGVLRVDERCARRSLVCVWSVSLALLLELESLAHIEDLVGYHHAHRHSAGVSQEDHRHHLGLAVENALHPPIPH